VCVTSMADDRLAALYGRRRWSEMYQAAHRVRPLLNQRRIVITCAIPLPGLEPTEVVYSPPRTQREQTMEKLERTARSLLDEHGYVTRGDLARVAGIHKSTVGYYWYGLVDRLNLHLGEITVPSARYPKGRPTQAALR